MWRQVPIGIFFFFLIHQIFFRLFNDWASDNVINCMFIATFYFHIQSFFVWPLLLNFVSFYHINSKVNKLINKAKTKGFF